MAPETLPLAEFEDLLVNEFQVCQDLLALTRAERIALLTGDVFNLARLVERKEVLLDALSQWDDQRRQVKVQLDTSQLALPGSPSVSPLPAQPVSTYFGRFQRLREGISALADEIRELTRGNQALASAAAGRAFAMQRSLLDLLAPAQAHEYALHARSGMEAVWQHER